MKRKALNYIYTNGELWLILIFFLWQGQIRENAEKYDFIKNGIYSFPNEFVKIYEFKRSMSLFDL